MGQDVLEKKQNGNQQRLDFLLNKLKQDLCGIRFAKSKIVSWK
jgi:hypothetical protein